MTYRFPYMFAGELCDFDQSCINACELQRLTLEAEGVVVPTVDLTEAQSDE